MGGLENDPREWPAIVDMEGEGGRDMLTGANLQILSTDGADMSKDVQNWTQRLDYGTRSLM
jgi:hypothetical protein